MVTRSLIEITYQIRLIGKLLRDKKTLSSDCKLILETWLKALKWFIKP